MTSLSAAVPKPLSDSYTASLPKPCLSGQTAHSQAPGLALPASRAKTGDSVCVLGQPPTSASHLSAVGGQTHEGISGTN